MRAWVLLGIGVLLLAIAVPALAQAQAVPGAGPDWQTVATTVCGALFLGVGAYLRGLGQRIGDEERRSAAFRESILRDYLPKGEAEKAIAASNAVVRAQLEALTREIAGLTARLDAARKGEPA